MPKEKGKARAKAKARARQGQGKGRGQGLCKGKGKGKGMRTGEGGGKGKGKGKAQARARPKARARAKAKPFSGQCSAQFLGVLDEVAPVAHLPRLHQPDLELILQPQPQCEVRGPTVRVHPAQAAPAECLLRAESRDPTDGSFLDPLARDQKGNLS